MYILHTHIHVLCMYMQYNNATTNNNDNNDNSNTSNNNSINRIIHQAVFRVFKRRLVVYVAAPAAP